MWPTMSVSSGPQGADTLKLDLVGPKANGQKQEADSGSEDHGASVPGGTEKSQGIT